MDLLTKLDCTIKKIWMENIKKDYGNDLLFREDALKNALITGCWFEGDDTGLHFRVLPHNRLNLGIRYRKPGGGST